MAWRFLSFESNPEGLAIGVFLIVLAISSYVFGKMMNNKGVGMLVSIIISLIAAWQLYNGGFYGWEGTIALLIYIALVGIALKMIIGFFKFVGGVKYPRY